MPAGLPTALWTIPLVVATIGLGLPAMAVALVIAINATHLAQVWRAVIAAGCAP